MMQNNTGSNPAPATNNFVTRAPKGAGPIRVNGSSKPKAQARVWKTVKVLSKPKPQARVWKTVKVLSKPKPQARVWKTAKFLSKPFPVGKNVIASSSGV